jgi:multidrug resistance efflux pump
MLQINKTEGELIKRGEQVAEIGSGEFIAKLLIVEEDINKIKVGQEVFIELNTDKNKSYKAYYLKFIPFSIRRNNRLLPKPNLRNLFTN